MDNTDLKTLNSICSKILSELELLTSATKASALIKFQSEFLITDQQRKIYEAIDGDKDSQALAVASGASVRSVQTLIKSLLEKDLIDVERKGHSVIPIKSTSKIATYYAKQSILNVGGNTDE